MEELKKTLDAIINRGDCTINEKEYEKIQRPARNWFNNLGKSFPTFTFASPVKSIASQANVFKKDTIDSIVAIYNNHKVEIEVAVKKLKDSTKEKIQRANTIHLKFMILAHGNIEKKFLSSDAYYCTREDVINKVCLLYTSPSPRDRG